MPYLPPGTIPITGADNVMPRSNSIDLWRAVTTIEERWRRYCPTLVYRSLLKAPTSRPAAVLAGKPDPVIGAIGTTSFDPLWRERVDSSLNNGNWVQPHASTAAAVNPTEEDSELFRPDTELKFKVERELTESDLHKYGFDRVRDLLVFIPSSFFDRCGLTAQAGDVLHWDNRDFEVLQQSAHGFWYNTNIPLYVILNCTNRRKGS